MNVDLQETQNIIDTTKEQVYLQGKTHIGPHAKPRRGQVFHCHFGVGVGSEFQKRRPCVVLSNSINNMNSSVVVVAPITHTQKDLPICVPIADKRDAGGTVVLDGCANLSGLRSVSSYRLAGLICELEKSEMDKIDAAIARHLDVIRHYNTLLAVIQDDKDHIEKLNAVLNKLREVTGAVSNMGLLETVEKLVAESAENSKNNY